MKTNPEHSVHIARIAAKASRGAAITTIIVRKAVDEALRYRQTRL